VLEQELSHKLIGIAMQVQNLYGSAHQEIIYQRALEEILRKEQISFLAQPRLPVRSPISQKILGFYKPDFLVSSKIIVEIKAVPYPIARFEQQISSYLKNSPYEIGYLINFGIHPLYYRRLFHTKDRKISPHPPHPPSSVLSHL
jgi:GxxExxY protein